MSERYLNSPDFAITLSTENHRIKKPQRDRAQRKRKRENPGEKGGKTLARTE